MPSPLPEIALRTDWVVCCALVKEKGVIRAIFSTFAGQESKITRKDFVAKQAVEAGQSCYRVSGMIMLFVICGSRWVI